MSNQNTRNWNILNWNVRGLNSTDKCNDVRAKIEESASSIVCIQETKKPAFDSSFIRKIAPKRFNKFAYVPSQGASGGILMAWNGTVFSGQVIHSQFAITVAFIALLNSEQWKLTVVYDPCHGQDMQSFSNWLNNLQISTDENWMIVGDFNFYRSMENRNRGGANIQDIMTFNQIISNLGLQEIPLKGRNYT
jgi:exonuclease III